MKIALDAHGGDFGINPNLEGALRAVKELGIEVVLVGNETDLKAGLEGLGASREKRVSVVHAPTVVGMEAEPVEECRTKPDSSIMVCGTLVAEKKADAMMSAGNSGATMVASFLKLGRIKGISRPAIATPLPSLRGTFVLLDAGANTECTPQQLAQFGMMGSVYARLALGIPEPSVGIVSIGEEETKGNNLTKETVPLLKKSGLRFTGPVEGRDIPMGTTDVVVCDGFTGNIILKLMEGMGKAMFEMIKRELSTRPVATAGALLAKPAFKAIKRRMNPDEQGGALLLGINGVSLIGHGRTSSTAIFNALRVASHMVETKVNDQIAQEAVKLNAAIKEAKA